MKSVKQCLKKKKAYTDTRNNVNGCHRHYAESNNDLEATLHAGATQQALEGGGGGEALPSLEWRVGCSEFHRVIP